MQVSVETPAISPYAPAEIRSVKLSKKLLIGIGDVHGHYPALESILKSLDDAYRIFLNPETMKLNSKAELIFTGDYVDRGNHNRKVIDAMMALKENNESVHELFGNHELMALACLDDARRIARQGEYGALDTYTTFTLHGRNGGDAFVREFGKNGYVLGPYIRAMEKGSPVGDWMRNLEAMRLVRIFGKNVLFVHGGIPYTIADRTDLRNYLDKFENHMKQGSAALGGTLQKYLRAGVVDNHSVFWDRRIPEKSDETEIREMAEDLRVDYIVIGHTPHRKITSYFDIAFDIDVGMTPAYGENEPAAIVFKPEGIFAFYALRGEEKLADY